MGASATLFFGLMLAIENILHVTCWLGGCLPAKAETYKSFRETMVKLNTIAVIVAAGRGSRAGAGGPKQYRLLVGQAVIARTVEAFLGHPDIDGVRVIIHRDDREEYDAAMGALLKHRKLLDPVTGGAERQDSVRLGLESISENHPSRVLIHDAARPFIDAKTITRVINALDTADGAIAALPVHDTIKREGADKKISATVPREALWPAQTSSISIWVARRGR